jgi:hypothetical protein
MALDHGNHVGIHAWRGLHQASADLDVLANDRTLSIAERPLLDEYFARNLRLAEIEKQAAAAFPASARVETIFSYGSARILAVSPPLSSRIAIASRGDNCGSEEPDWFWCWRDVVEASGSFISFCCISRTFFSGREPRVAST